jgi:hypothetical protein
MNESVAGPAAETRGAGPLPADREHAGPVRSSATGDGVRVRTMAREPELMIEVAAYGPSASATFSAELFDGPRFETQQRELRWEDRERVTVTVRPSQTLADVIDLAADSFGVSVPFGGPRGTVRVSDRIAGVALDQRGSPDAFRPYFVGIDVDGLLRWGRPDQITMAELLRAIERRLETGDARRVYFWPMVPQGGEIVIGYWPSFTQLLKLLWKLAEDMGVVYTAAQAFTSLRERLRRSQGATEKVAGTMLSRNGGPAQLLRLLRDQRLSTDDAAALLGIDRETTTALLAGWGLDRDGRGDWSVSTAPDGLFAWHLAGLMVDCARLQSPSLDAFERVAAESLKGFAADHTRVPTTSDLRERLFASATPGPPGGDPQDGTDDDSPARRVRYKLVSITPSSDLDAIEARLNELGAAGYAIAHLVETQATSRHQAQQQLLILTLDKWD